jgi:signal transduction histidine kinase
MERLRRLGARLRPALRVLNLRRDMYAVAIGLGALCTLVTLAEASTNVVWAGFLPPVVGVTALAAPRSLRATILAVGAGLLAVYQDPLAGWLWIGLVSLIFFAVAEDQATVPWRGWACGFAGSALSLVVYPEGDALGFIAVAFGGGAAMLLRLRGRTRWLEIRTRQLQTQTVWLEQRTALARELHDVVGHHVTAMVVQAEAGQMGDREAALRTIADVGRTALKDLDALVVHLRDPGAALEVSASPRLGDIDELLAEPLRQQGVEVVVSLDDDPGLDEVQVLTVYRIAQEALTNVVKHARATQVWVDVRRQSDQLRLRVSDDGTGLPTRTEGPEPVGRSGLIGIGERVLALGGTWEITERPGGGTMLDVRVPLSS